jgi:hypothetical protein
MTSVPFLCWRQISSACCKRVTAPHGHSGYCRCRFPNWLWEMQLRILLAGAISLGIGLAATVQVPTKASAEEALESAKRDIARPRQENAAPRERVRPQAEKSALTEKSALSERTRSRAENGGLRNRAAQTPAPAVSRPSLNASDPATAPNTLPASSGWQETTELVSRTLRGWANIFDVGTVSTASRATDDPVAAPVYQPAPPPSAASGSTPAYQNQDRGRFPSPRGEAYY